MYPNQQPPMFTTRHYIHDPQSSTRYDNYSSYNQPRPAAQPYPYYTSAPQPTSVTYINGRSNYAPPPPPPPPSSQPMQYAPPNPNYYPPANSPVRTHYAGPPGGGGGIEKTNYMSNESPFRDPARSHENYNTPRATNSITTQPKSDGSLNKTLNLSEESPFHSVYGRYHYPSQIDPSKRITTQNAPVRSTDNKSLNLSEESPFYSTYGRYFYPSQIDPSKRITEMPKAAGPLAPTNETSTDNPFNNYQPSTYRDYPSGGGGGPAPYTQPYNNYNQYKEPPPVSYRPVEVQRPQQNYYNPQQASYNRPPNPPSPPPPPPPPAPAQPPKPSSSAPQDKTSLNMSPDNPFAATYGQYYYPSAEEIKSQKRANERNARFADQQPVSNNMNDRPVQPQQPKSQMTEYPESEKKEIQAGKGNTKFSRFDVNF